VLSALMAVKKRPKTLIRATKKIEKTFLDFQPGSSRNYDLKYFFVKLTNKAISKNTVCWHITVPDRATSVCTDPTKLTNQNQDPPKRNQPEKGLNVAN